MVFQNATFLLGVGAFVALRNGLFGHRNVTLPRDATNVKLDEGFIWSELTWQTKIEEGSAFFNRNQICTLFPLSATREKE